MRWEVASGLGLGGGLIWCQKSVKKVFKNGWFFGFGAHESGRMEGNIEIKK